MSGISMSGLSQFSDLPPDPLPAPDRMLKHFEYSHLPPHLQNISRPFYLLAHDITSDIEPGQERTAALRKLLESKDCAVRAKLHPGG